MLAVRRRPVDAARTRMSFDEIEQRLIGAYVQLACGLARRRSATATVAWIGELELRLTEVPEEQRLPGLTWLWLETYCHEERAVVDRCECNELESGELTRLLEFTSRQFGRHASQSSSVLPQALQATVWYAPLFL